MNMENFEFLMNWPFWVGLVLGIVVGPHVKNLLEKIKK